MIVEAMAPSATVGWFACRRPPRSTCASAPIPARRLRSISSPSSTAYPLKNGTDESSSRRPAASPESGWAKPASSG